MTSSWIVMLKGLVDVLSLRSSLDIFLSSWEFQEFPLACWLGSIVPSCRDIGWIQRHRIFFFIGDWTISLGKEWFQFVESTMGIFFLFLISHSVSYNDPSFLHLFQFCNPPVLGAVSIRKTVLPGMAIPMLKIRRPNGRLIFNMEIAIRR